jgi:hypothetical protein
MSITELPDLILFATHDSFDPAHDTIQICKVKPVDELMDRAFLRAEISARVFFAGKGRNGSFRIFPIVLRLFEKW